MAAGNFHMVRADWNREYMDELMAFPKGTHDDQVDAAPAAAALGISLTPLDEMLGHVLT